MRISENISQKDFYSNSTVSDKPKSIGITELLFLTYILILPIESSDFLEFSIEYFHISVVDLLLLAVLYLVSIKMIGSNSRLSFLPLKFVLLFLLAILSSTISLFYLPWNEDISYDLKVTLNLFEYLAIFYITTSLARDMAILNKILFTLCISLLGFSVLTILKSIGIDLPGYQRGDGIQVGPFYVGAVALFNSILPVSLLTLGAFPIVISGIVSKRLWIIMPLAAIILLSSILTYSRSLWIALTLQAFLSLYFTFYSKRNSMKKILFVAFISALLLILYEYFNKTYFFMEGIRPSTVQMRLSGYQIAIDMVLSKFHFIFFGAGEGSYIQTYAWFTGEETVVHNFVLNILVSKGLVTLSLILSVISMIIYNLFKIRKSNSNKINSYSTLFLLSLFGMIVEGMMAPITNSLIFWTYLALAYSFVLIVKRRIPFSKSYI